MSETPLSDAIIAEWNAMLESELKRRVIKIATDRGWRVHHITNSWNARGAQKGNGFPDLVLGRRRRLIYVELKRQKESLSADQVIWREIIEGSGAPYYLWRPSDLMYIEEDLT